MFAKKIAMVGTSCGASICVEAFGHRIQAVADLDI